ncbi:MAG TPA: hypothetical protein VHW00_05275 [Thermoanaerobaculia bacterium]|nr:hypothetical protein [Thermoanaerobaculia bacterium]
MRRSSAFAALCRPTFWSGLLLAALATPLFAAELVLVPLWYQGPGSQGSYWTTHLSVYNTGGYVEPYDRGVLPCQWLLDPCPRGFWKQKMLVYEAPQSMSGGFVMAVENADNLAYTLRVFEQNAQLEDLGVDIPVVRERDLRTGAVQLMDIPASDPELFRYLLRIYGVGQASSAVVRVNGYLSMGDGSSDLVVTREVRLTQIGHGLGHYYAEETELVRQLIQYTGGMGQLRIEIEPMSPNLRWWGMLSATNNRTQDVTIVTPN